MIASFSLRLKEEKVYIKPEEDYLPNICLKSTIGQAQIHKRDQRKYMLTLSLSKEDT